MKPTMEWTESDIWTNHLRWRLEKGEKFSTEEAAHVIYLLCDALDKSINERNMIASKIVDSLNELASGVGGDIYHVYDRCSCS